MTQYWYIENNFAEVRAGRIGASEISCLIPNPDKPSESLAGVWKRGDGTIDNRTALTLWREKTGRAIPSPAGLAAEMGHWNEIKAIELFIRGIPEIGERMAAEYVESRLRYETAVLSDPNRRASRYQPTPFKHNTQWYNDQFVVHPDGVWDCAGCDRDLADRMCDMTEGGGIVSAHGHTIDLSKPFLIEAKNHSYYATRRKDTAPHSGYDFTISGWQGIPLKEYVQCQFQMAIFDVEKDYLTLITDAAFGIHHVWEVRRDRKIGDDLIDLAGKFMWYVRKDQEPRDMAINLDDIVSLYPTVQEDFRTVSGADADAIIDLARRAKDASAQEKAWKEKKEDAQSALAVHLKDTKELRVLLDGEMIPVVKWTEREGSEYVSLGDMDAETVNGLRAKGLVKTRRGSRSVNVCFKEE